MTPEYIPERPKDANYRTLIVLLDGTGDSDDDDVIESTNEATNIVFLDKILYNGTKYPGDDKKQLVHYSTGIGADTTQTYAGLISYAWKKARNTVDQAVANSFETHLLQAYKWLADKYQDNDKICIFGFSRGAYTARALAGMLNAMGLLRVSDDASVKAAYDLYAEYNKLPPDSTDAQKKARNTAWNTLFSDWERFRNEQKVKTPFIEFLGCWDSVNSVGFMDAIKLSHTATNDMVRTFRHALALDERRAKFKQNIWSPPKEPADTAHDQLNGVNRPSVVKRPSVVTDVQEVWFAGCHCDIGGGSVLNGTRPNLAHIPLRWMIRECFKANTGIIFSAHELAKLGIEPSHLYPSVRPRQDVDMLALGSYTIPVEQAPGWGSWAKSFVTSSKPQPRELSLPNLTEDELDVRDAHAPLFDQLVLKSSTWQLLETLATKKSVHDETSDTWKEVWKSHNSVGRSIPPANKTHGGKVRVHRTVRMRMQGKHENGPEKGKPYIPKARLGWEHDFEKKLPFAQIDPKLIEWVS
ncbi:hypothetical protein GGX14DRAFT_545445 [Mycena pura]|uniref:T6SS Phospholipase effector Tle1-like catalytic domain-containing protein n=1 Tax=Mycena pura TaxID=153505 RepID=A0AAD6Y9A6_9AGAR|nr:hypothetical protein GGX14DRAFT_545445 [Mycena pura]